MNNVEYQITECKQAEKALLETEIRYRTLFENAYDCIFMMKEDKFIDCNPRTLEIFGCTREQLLGQTPYRFSPAIQPDGHNSKETAQEKITLALQGVSQHFDWRHIRYDGTPFDAEISLNRIELSGQMFLQAIMRDVTERKHAEKALRKERDMAQKYLDIAEVIFAIINTDQRITLINKKGCEILEYQLEEIIGRKVDILVPERLKKEIKNRANKVFTGKMEVAEYIERPLLTKSGRERILALHQTLLRDDEGNITGFLSSGVDITERKRMEEELQKSEQRWRKYFELGLIGMAVLSPEGAVLEGNDQLSEILGYSLDELKNMSLDELDELVHPEDRPSAAKRWNRVLAGETDGYKYEERFIRKDGKIIYVNISTKCAHEAGGSVDFFIMLIQDITQRKEAEEELRLMSKVFKDASDPIIIEDLDGRIIDLNLEAERIYGWTRNELLGQPIKTLVPPQRHKQADELLEQCKQGEIVRNREGVRWDKAGQKYPVLLTLSLLVNEVGEPIAVATITKHITELKEAEEALQKAHTELEAKVVERTRELTQANLRLQELDRLKSMFIASMSHELRTPLNSVIGFSSILLDEWVGSLNDEQKKNLSIVLRSGQHLLALINDVIDVSKIEAGQIEPFIEDFDLHEVISEATTYLSKQVNQNKLELKVESAHHMMHTDRRRLLQCLLNLISNAAKFTEEGYICLDARIVECSQNPPCAQISVADTGSGIKKEDLPKLFFSFSRIDSPLRKKVPGTGLGLYLTKKLLTEILKGEISVKSEYGVGSRFTMKIPVRIKYNGEVKNVSKQ